MSSEVYVLSAVRTPIGRFGGSLKDTSAAHLGAHAMKASIDRASVDPGSLDLVAFGNVLRAGQGQLIPRQSAFEAGIPDHVDAVAVDMVCSSGMMSMMVASMAIRSGEADLVLAGGTESMSGTGFYISDDARWGLKYGGQPLVDILAHDGLTDPFSGEAMGVQTERLAAERGVTRAELDSIAYESHARAAHAQGSGAFANELAPIQYRSRRDTLTLEHDEGVRADTSVDALAKLRPAFTPEGVLTAGNSSQISDGAAAVMLASGKWVKENNAKPIARITASSWAAGEPYKFPEAPIPAIKRVLDKTGTSLEHYDLFENNEAFALNSVLLNRMLNVPHEKLNVNGGAIALGHPIGCSGTRIVVTLIHALRNRGHNAGMASICHGTGGGTALAVEVV